MQQAPAVTATPAGAPGAEPLQIVVNGQPLTSPQAIYQGFRAQRRELSRQMEALEDSRQEIAEQLSSPTVAPADQRGLELRLTAIDERIIALDRQLAEADAQVARSAAVPGAAVEPPSPPRSGPPEEAWVLGGMFIMVVLLPISLAFARRIWRRSAKVITTFPKELSDRLMRVEQSVEATALEVERIGEGQRFMTKLFTDGTAPQQRIGVPSRD